VGCTLVEGLLENNLEGEAAGAVENILELEGEIIKVLAQDFMKARARSPQTKGTVENDALFINLAR
jgi:hypothetical protein